MSIFQTIIASGQKKEQPNFKWTKAAVLPSPPGHDKSLGIAGPVQGVNNGVLIIGGGSNFPGKMPWLGGGKVYYNKVYVLEWIAGKYDWNHKVNDTLPEAISYCGCTSTEEGIVYIGGQNKGGLSAKCYLLTFDKSENKLNFERLADLPVQISNAGVTHIGTKIYVAGGDDGKHSSDQFFCLELHDQNREWQKLADLPIPLGNSTVIAQNFKTRMEVFVIGGRTKGPDGTTVFHSSTFAFNPEKNNWRKCADISDGKTEITLAAGSGVPLDGNQVLLTGGDNGKVFHQIEALNLQIQKAKDEEEQEKLIQKRNQLNVNHQGFDKRLLLYDTNKDSWKKVGTLPFPAHVTTTDVMWNGKIVISNGEKRPGVRAPAVMIGMVK